MLRNARRLRCGVTAARRVGRCGAGGVKAAVRAACMSGTRRLLRALLSLIPRSALRAYAATSALRSARAARYVYARVCSTARANVQDAAAAITRAKMRRADLPRLPVQRLIRQQQQQTMRRHHASTVERCARVAAAQTTSVVCLSQSIAAAAAHTRKGMSAR